MITAEKLRARLDYDPATGLFTWRENQRRHSGKLAGTIGVRGYIQIMLDKRQYRAHRLAWLHVHGAWPATALDHINGIHDDNRIKNLRLATPSQNGANRVINGRSTSGFKGVSFQKDRSKWRAQIRVNWKPLYLGLFETAEDAHAAYLAAAKLHFGEYARAK
jgi:hypothetical protein